MRKELAELEKYLPRNVFESLSHFSDDKLQDIQEIRLRLGRACSVSIGNKNEILIDYRTGKMLCQDESQMQACFKRICENSIYKYESEIKNGYITMAGGYRVGFCGSRIENGLIKDISSINIRLTRKIKDAASEIFPLLQENGYIKSSLIVSLPCAGKTTILTDVAFRFSEIRKRVAVIDERGEIAAAHRGMPQKNVGSMCDVLNNYPKGEGMMIALRSLSPQVLICDEIGSKEDVAAMLQAMNAGVPVIASAHAADPSQLMRRPQIRYLIESGGIERFFFLEGPAHPGKLRRMLTVEELYEICSNRIDRSQHLLGCSDLS